MYHGTTRVIQRYHRDKYYPGIGTLAVPSGTVEVLQHHYTCDTCGRTFAFPQAAEEPFYCHSPICRAVTLVSIARGD